jgi:hypothetical protein
MVAAAAERSGGRCECDGKCGIAHAGGRCRAVNGEPHPFTGSVVVLTLAHEYGVPLEETSIERMFHACQRCHNRYDMPSRRAGMRERAFAAHKELFGWTDEDGTAPAGAPIPTPNSLDEQCRPLAKLAEIERLAPGPVRDAL